MTPLDHFNCITPLGPAICVGILDEGSAIEWVTFIKATGEPWLWRNPQFRIALDITAGRSFVSPFGEPHAGLARQIERYRANGWLPPAPAASEPSHGGYGEACRVHRPQQQRQHSSRYPRHLHESKAMTDRSDRAGGVRAKLEAFNSYLNEPPPYEDKMRVREYRHAAYAKWSPLLTDILDLLAASPPSGNAGEGAAEDDPTISAEWNAGCDFAMEQLCSFLGVDSAAVTWDAATETVDGDVRAVIGNILRAKFGEDWAPTAPLQPAPDAVREALTDAILHLEDAQSGFISGCGSDTAWLNKRDEIVNAARAALSTPNAESTNGAKP